METIMKINQIESVKALKAHILFICKFKLNMNDKLI